VRLLRHRPLARVQPVADQIGDVCRGSGPSRWAVVSDLGGIAEVNATCPAYGGPFCTYPWYALNAADQAFTFGADYPGTKFDYNQAAQFATTPLCGGPFGPDSTFCDTVLSPTP